MKKIVLMLSVLTILSTMIFVTSIPCFADDIWISILPGTNLNSVAYGQKVSENFGFEVGYTQDNRIDGTGQFGVDSKAVSSDFGDNIDQFQNKTSFGGDILWFPIKYLYVGTGIYYVVVDSSNGRETTWTIPYSIGFQSAINYKYVLGVGYHSIRGINLRLGIKI